MPPPLHPVTQDRYFGNVCELDLTNNTAQAYAVMDQLVCDGLVQEGASNKASLLRVLEMHDTAK